MKYGTMSNTENMSELLELGREKLSEGDYLKLATFLQNLHTTHTTATRVAYVPPAVVNTLPLNVVVEFKTVKGKEFVIHLDTLTKTTAYGPGREAERREETVIGKFNLVPFTMLETDFIKKMYTLLHFYGMKDIRRSCHGEHEETHEIFHDFSEHARDDYITSFSGPDDEDADYGNSDILRILFGLHLNSELY